MPGVPDEDQKTFVLVDDSDDLYVLIEEAMEVVGSRFKLGWFKDGEKLFKYLSKSETPAVILLDMKMPKMSGEEIWNRLRRDEKFSSIPVVFMTNHPTASRPPGVPADRFKSKPQSFAELVELVKFTVLLG